MIDDFFMQINNFQKFAPVKYSQIEERVRLIDRDDYDSELIQHVIDGLYEEFGINEEMDQSDQMRDFERQYPETMVVQNLGVIKDDIIQVSYEDEQGLVELRVDILGIEPVSRDPANAYAQCLREDTGEHLRRLI